MFHVTRRSDPLVWVLTPAAVGSLIGSLLVALCVSMCHVIGPILGWQTSRANEVREVTRDEIESRVAEVRRLVESRGYGRAPGFPAASCIGDGTCGIQAVEPVSPRPPSYPHRRNLPAETTR